MAGGRRRQRGKAHDRRRRRPFRVVERVILGVIMSVAAFVTERLLIRGLAKSGKRSTAPNEIGLALASSEVDDQARHQKS